VIVMVMLMVIAMIMIIIIMMMLMMVITSIIIITIKLKICVMDLIEPPLYLLHLPLRHLYRIIYFQKFGVWSLGTRV
jgi:hypothetical protein